MPEAIIALLGLCLAVNGWATEGGSHIPADKWAQYPDLIAQGVKAALYVLWANNSPCHEDLRRLRQDAGRIGLGFDVLVLRLGWESGKRPPSPEEYWAIYRERVKYALALGYKRVLLLLFNEPNLELVIRDKEGRIVRVVMTPAEFRAWYAELVTIVRADCPGVPIVSPPIGGYADNSWEWWDHAVRDCGVISDLAGVNLYPVEEAELVGDWSLGWWQGQAPDKRLVVCEMGCRTGTPASVRAALLPKLYRLVKQCVQVDLAFAFVQWTESTEHAEHWLSLADQRALVDANAGLAPGGSTEISLPFLPVGGKMTFKLTLERVE